MGFLRRVGGLVRKVVDPVTPLGWTVLALGLVVWFVAARFDWEEAFVLAAICLVLFGFGVVWTFGRLSLYAQFSVTPARLVVGERAAGELLITNLRRFSAYGLRIEMPIGDAVAPFEITRLKGGDTADELFVVPTNRRAIIPCGPVTSVKGDPLGLMRRVERWSGMHEIFVHPKTIALEAIAAGQIRDLEGQTTSALSPSDIAFHTLREYAHGDDLRHVHWKSSAKIGTLMVRQYNDTRRSHIAVVLSTDLDEYGEEEEFELAISCAASVALQTMRDGQTLTMIAGETMLPATDPVRLLDLFSGLEGKRGSGGLDSAMQAIRRQAGNASVAVMCSGNQLSVSDIRTSVARARLEMMNIVLMADHSGTVGYRSIGDSTFVTVPALQALRRGLMAVAS